MTGDWFRSSMRVPSLYLVRAFLMAESKVHVGHYTTKDGELRASCPALSALLGPCSQYSVHGALILFYPHLTPMFPARNTTVELFPTSIHLTMGVEFQHTGPWGGGYTQTFPSIYFLPQEHFETIMFSGNMS